MEEMPSLLPILFFVIALIITIASYLLMKRFDEHNFRAKAKTFRVLFYIGIIVIGLSICRIAVSVVELVRYYLKLNFY